MSAEAEYTPTTDQVRSHYVFDQSNRWSANRGLAYDRWLADHDAEVRAEQRGVDARIALNAVTTIRAGGTP